MTRKHFSILYDLVVINRHSRKVPSSYTSWSGQTEQEEAEKWWTDDDQDKSRGSKVFRRVMTANERVPGRGQSLQRVSSTCTSWPLIPEWRWVVSFTFTANTASSLKTPSLSQYPLLWWNWKATLHTLKNRVCFGLNRAGKHGFYGSKLPF